MPANDPIDQLDAIADTLIGIQKGLSAFELPEPKPDMDIPVERAADDIDAALGHLDAAVASIDAARRQLRSRLDGPTVQY